MNYLQLCQNYVAELGLSGNSGLPNQVTGQTGELNNVTRWIRDAALNLDNLWLDWKYLWVLYDQVVTPSPTSLALPAPPGGVLPRLWNADKMRWRLSGSSPTPWSKLDYYPRVKMEQIFDTDNASPGPPSAWTINPDNSLELNCPPDQAYEFRCEFWRRPLVLAANADTPLIPAEHHRIIVCRAAVMYGNREDAPEIISGLTAEYIDMLDKLQSDQLEGFELRRSSTDRSRTTPVPGIDQWLRG